MMLMWKVETPKPYTESDVKDDEMKDRDDS
jgi:hypothetical protein